MFYERYNINKEIENPCSWIGRAITVKVSLFNNIHWLCNLLYMNLMLWGGHYLASSFGLSILIFTNVSSYLVDAGLYNGYTFSVYLNTEATFTYYLCQIAQLH